MFLRGSLQDPPAAGANFDEFDSSSQIFPNKISVPEGFFGTKQMKKRDFPRLSADFDS